MSPRALESKVKRGKKHRKPQNGNYQANDCPYDFVFWQLDKHKIEDKKHNSNRSKSHKDSGKT